MIGLLLRVRRAAASLLGPRTIAVQEDACWCGIHHLGVGYVHPRPTAVWSVSNIADPTAPTVAELDAGLRIDGITNLEN